MNREMAQISFATQATEKAEFEARAILDNMSEQVYIQVVCNVSREIRDRLNAPVQLQSVKYRIR